MKTTIVQDGAAEALAPVADSFGVMNRRALLTGSGIVASAVSGLALVQPAKAFDATPAENAPRYKESEHVKTFYRLASR